MKNFFWWRKVPKGGDGIKRLRDWRLGHSVMLVSVIILAGLIAVGAYWSREPDLASVSNPNAVDLPLGVATVESLATVIDVLLQKPGGYLSNDVMPPGVWLDNIPSWEFGVLVQVRDLSKALRESFSRSQSQSTEDRDLALAEPRFNVDHLSWAVPWPESEYTEGQTFLRNYRERLDAGQAVRGEFFARADNLRYWLATVETRLGSLSQRLSASVGQPRIDGLPLSADAGLSGQKTIKTDWHRIDNVFYEARGTMWALIHFLRAIEIDFADALEKKNATTSLQQIIRELEMSQQSVSAPMIMNGSGLGIFANHSLVMASYVSRANAALIDLRELLAQG